MKILICGKGGSGKSTVSALLALAMAERGKRVLIVDADESNVGLYRMLGLNMPQPLMDSFGGKKGFREKTAAVVSLDGTGALFPKKMTINSLPEACVSSAGDIHVMSIGKIHHFGEGCACPMGKLFRTLFSSLDLQEEDLVIVDTAAGVEHFGRSLDSQCDMLLCIVDPSYESITMAKRVNVLAREAGLPAFSVLNRIEESVADILEEGLEADKTIGKIPASRDVFISNLKGRKLDSSLPEINLLCEAIETVFPGCRKKAATGRVFSELV